MTVPVPYYYLASLGSLYRFLELGKGRSVFATHSLIEYGEKSCQIITSVLNAPTFNGVPTLQIGTLCPTLYLYIRAPSATSKARKRFLPRRKIGAGA